MVANKAHKSAKKGYKAVACCIRQHGKSSMQPSMGTAQVQTMKEAFQSYKAALKQHKVADKVHKAAKKCYNAVACCIRQLGKSSMQLGLGTAQVQNDEGCF